MISVLIIDDDNVDFEAMSRIIYSTLGNDISIKHVTNGTDAIVELQDNTFDCVVLDYLLPGENGLDILRRLDAADLHPPILFATGKGAEIIATQAINLGAQNYFPKDCLSSNSDLFAKCIINSIEMSTLHRIEEECNKLRTIPRK